MTAIGPLSPTATLIDGRVPDETSTARKYLLLIVFCLAQFLDAFNNSALFSAIPSLITTLHMTESESTWLISAFQLTFASFLLVVSSVYDLPMYFGSTRHGFPEWPNRRRVQPKYDDINLNANVLR
jgi:hypothetical protein